METTDHENLVAMLDRAGYAYQSVAGTVMISDGPDDEDAIAFHFWENGDLQSIDVDPEQE